MAARRIWVALAAVAVVAVLAVVWTTRGGVEPGRGIVFEAKVGRLYQLFTIRPDGSDLDQLTHLELRNSSIPGAEQPAWSPDGRTIMFDTDYRRTKRRVISLFSVRPDGSHLEQVPLDLGLFVGAPAYSPDGKTISFDWDENAQALHEQGINLAKTDGSDVRRLTALREPNRLHQFSTWSSDGRWIAFAEWRGDGQSAILKMRLDGSGLMELTPWELNANHADWSPDGSRILFNSNNEPQPGESMNLYTMKPDGTGVVQLTHYKGGMLNAYAGDWSPDGTKIVFQLRGADPFGPGVNQLYVVDADGRHLRQLTHLPHGMNPQYASWSPAG